MIISDVVLIALIAGVPPTLAIIGSTMLQFVTLRKQAAVLLAQNNEKADELKLAAERAAVVINDAVHTQTARIEEVFEIVAGMRGDCVEALRMVRPEAAVEGTERRDAPAKRRAD